MSCVHYKFKSAVNVETITFDGMHISVADLKKAIIQQKKMGKLMENFDLQLSKPQSFDVYKDTDLIPKNSSVIVARIPVERTNKSRSWDPSRIDMSTALSSQKAEANAQEKLQKSADLVNMKGSEEEKVKLMMLQSGKEYSQANYIKPRYPTGPPPRNYVCHRCGQPGHFINACPNRDDGDMTHRLKRSTGIPNSFMTPVVDPNVPGVLMTNTGQLAVPKIDAIAYLQGKKEKPPFVKSDSPERKQDEKIIPGELLCPVCKDLLMDAVVAPCCGNSACDECIRDALIDSDEHVCPICKESGISPDALIPNKFMRTAVNNFQNETGYTTIKRRNQLEISQPPPAPPAAASKPEAERQSIALPPHLVGMPPQVIKAELASKEMHGLGTPSPGLQHARDASFSVEPGSAAQAILGGYAIQRTGMTPRLQTVVRSAPYSVVHRQSPAVGSDIIMSHTPTNLVQMSQGKHGDSPHAPPGAYLDERGILHQTPHARPRLMHPSVRQWPHGPGLRGSILIPGRGGHRMTVLRPSSVGTRRLGLLPPPGESHFSASVPEHGFPPSAAVGLVSHNPIPGPLPPQGMPGRVPQQQPPSQVAPGMIRIPAPPHPSGPPQQIIYSRLPPPAGPGSRLMGQEMIITPPQGFIPPLMPTANANLPPPVPLTEEEFYREKERLLELERKRKAVDSVEATVGRKKVDPMDDFEELLQKKSRPKGVSLYHTSNSRSRSRTRSPSRSYTKSRSRSRSLKKRSRSLARSRSRSPVKSPLRRSRSIVRSRTRSRSRSRPFLRSKSRSRSRYASRKKSFTPKRSFTPVRRYSRSRSRTPLPKRPRSRSFTKSPRPRSRTRSRSPARPLKRISRSLSRSVSRSPLPSKRQPRSRSPASRGRSPPLPPAKRYRRSMSPRGRSMERSHGKPPPRYQPRDSAAHRYSPDRPRSGYKSSPHYDDRGYYRYPDKYDPRWTEYYRMLQDWYAKYDSFAHGLPSGYDNFGRLHSRGLPRSRSRSHSPRPLKRSHSPDDPAKWKRERSPKRMRMDVRDKSRTGRYEKDDARKLSDINRDKERRKDARPAASKSEKERSGAAGVDSDRFQHTPNKSDRRRGEDEDTARSQNHDRDDPRQQPRNKVDARDNRPESGGRKMGSKPLWDDRAEKTESRGRKAVSKPSRDRDNSEPREESSKIPVIGASAAVERRHSIGQNVIGDNQSSVGENLRVVKEEQPKDDKRMIKEEPPCESVKEEQPKEIKQVSNDGHGTKKDKVTRDLMDQEMEHKSKEPEVEWKAKDKETPKPKIEEPVAAAMTTKTRHREIEEPVAAATKTKARHREGSCGSEADRPVQHQSRSNKKLERPAAKEASESRRKLSDLQHAKARMSPSVEDVLYANIPTTSKWEKNQSDSDTEIPQPRWMDQEKERTSNLPRSVLESAENAVRHKPRSSVVSSVCSPPLPRSSIQRISTHSELSQQTKKSVKEKKASKDDKYQDVSLHQGRKVVQGPTSLSMKVTVSSNAKDSKEGKKGEKNSRAAEKYATPPSPVGVREVKRSISGDGRRNKDRDRGERGSTHREDDGKFSRKESHESGVGGNPSASSAKKDEPSKKTSGIRDRKASVFVDEDKFEPDYNESGSSDCEGSVVRATDKGYHNSMSDGRRQESSSEAEEVKAKQKKKHKKHKKLKKHKTKSSRKEDK